MKFGGTSVANYEAVSRMISIVEGRLAERPVVVVSALSKVTDLLYRLADAAAASDRDAVDEMLVELRERHLNLAKQLLEGHNDKYSEAKKCIDGICDSLASFVGAVCSLGELTPRSKAKIISNGEWLSSNIICYAMNARGIRTGFVDARSIMITSNDYLKGEPVISEIQIRAPEEI